MSININRVTEVIERSFSTEPLPQYFERSKQKLSAEVKLTYETHFKGQLLELIQRLASAGANVVEANNYNAVAIWLKPGFKNPEVEGPIAYGFQQFIHKTKQVYDELDIDVANVWHLQFIARDFTQEKKKGSIEKLLKPFLEKAKEDNLPAILESISEHATTVYQHYGFKVLKIIHIDDDICGGSYPLWIMAYNL